MKLFWCCVAAALLTITHAAVDVEKTVQHVQSILQANELLPRLTREEIIQLLNDIRAEDAKSTTKSKVNLNDIKTSTEKTITKSSNIIEYKNVQENEIATQPIQTKIHKNNHKEVTSASTPRSSLESTTKSSTPTLTVVLPYTPRDGASLQELYTKPPRLQVVAEEVTPKPIKSSKATEKSKLHEKQTNKPILDLPSELQAFLDAHGLKGKPGQDNFLLPLEGFKPLPPAKIVDGTVQLPENLLLTYDLISPSDLTTSTSNNKKDQTFAQTNFLYEPLKPEFPFELDTSSSERKQTVLPLDLPKPRKPKAIPSTPKPNYEPIDYEAVKVIPLNKGPNPIEDEVIVGNEQNKRQANQTDVSEGDSTTTQSTNDKIETKNSDVPDTIPLDSDTGASIADLEDSFGGAVPSEPGDSELPPPRKNGFYWMVDWNSFLEVGDGDTKVNIRFEPKLGDPQMFLPVNVP